MLVHNQSRYHAILERYHIKVNQPNYTYRKRGNPTTLIDAVAVLRGGKVCTVCKSLEDPELHHVDGNWRNNTLDNLKFYCHECHKQTHKEMQMNNQRTIWTEARANEIRREHAALVKTGKTKGEADAILAADLNVTPNYLGKIRTSGPDKIRAMALKSRQARGNSTATPTAFPRYTTSTNTGATMTVQEAMEFYMFVKRNGITIT